MAITLTEIKDRVERRLKDISDIDNDTWFDIATDLNQLLYRKLKGAEPDRVISSTTFTVTSSPSTQALPAGFRDAQGVGTGFFIRNNAGDDTEEKLVLTGFGSQEQGFYLDGTNVVFTGINTSTVIVLRYVATNADIDALADTFCVPDEYKDLVTEGLVMGYYKYEEDPREADSSTRFAQLLYEFLCEVKKLPRAYAFTTTLNQGS